MSGQHGSTPAAWTAVVLVIIGFSVASLAFVAAYSPGIYLGAGTIVLGGIAGKVMQLLGLGQEKA